MEPGKAQVKKASRMEGRLALLPISLISAPESNLPVPPGQASLFLVSGVPCRDAHSSPPIQTHPTILFQGARTYWLPLSCLLFLPTVLLASPRQEQNTKCYQGVDFFLDLGILQVFCPQGEVLTSRCSEGKCKPQAPSLNRREAQPAVQRDSGSCLNFN